MRGFSKPASESRAAQSVGGRRRCRRSGARAAGLRDQSDPPARPQQATDVAQSGGGLGPHADCVDRQCGVERPVGQMQALDRRVAEADPSGLDGGRVAPASLPCHHLRMVDTDQQPSSGAAGGAAIATPGPQPSSRTAVGRLDGEQVHRPAVALNVRGAPAHEPADGASGRSGRVMTLPPRTFAPLTPRDCSEAACGCSAISQICSSATIPQWKPTSRAFPPFRAGRPARSHVEWPGP